MPNQFILNWRAMPVTTLASQQAPILDTVHRLGDTGVAVSGDAASFGRLNHTGKRTALLPHNLRGFFTLVSSPYCTFLMGSKGWEAIRLLVLCASLPTCLLFLAFAFGSAIASHDYTEKVTT